MPSRRPDSTRERLRRKRLARWKASGLKVHDFCEREGVMPAAFAHGRKETHRRPEAGKLLGVELLDHLH